MKKRLFALLVVVAILMGMVNASPVTAAAYGTQFVTSITYLNIGTATANSISIDFYPGNGDAGSEINIPLAPLPRYAGTSLFVGSLSQVSSGFRGSALLNSDQPLAATLVQLPTGTTSVKNRPLSNGSATGAAYILVATALRNMFSTNSLISIQNADSVGADVQVDFVPVSGAKVKKTITNLKPGAAQYFDLGKMTELGASFNGSVQIFAKKTGTTNPGALIATSMELSTSNNNVYTFEGSTQSANAIYMPSAFCKYSVGIDTAYAVQNTSTSENASVTVVYSNGKSDGPYAITPGQKKSFPGCGVNGTLNPAGFIGSSVIKSTGGQIVAIGKVVGGGLSTAFEGFVSGSSTVALPYIRWTEAHWTDSTRQRANIAIQNVGATTLPAGSVKVNYYNKDGQLVGTDTNKSPIAQFGKFSSNAKMVGATEFGYSNGTGGGAVVVGPSGSQLAVIARIETYNAPRSVGEDYNGIPVQ